MNRLASLLQSLSIILGLQMEVYSHVVVLIDHLIPRDRYSLEHCIPHPGTHLFLCLSPKVFLTQVQVKIHLA